MTSAQDHDEQPDTSDGEAGQAPKDEERRSQKSIHNAGEPERDALGNESGAS